MTTSPHPLLGKDSISSLYRVPPLKNATTWHSSPAFAPASLSAPANVAKDPVFTVHDIPAFHNAGLRVCRCTPRPPPRCSSIRGFMSFDTTGHTVLSSALDVLIAKLSARQALALDHKLTCVVLLELVVPAPAASVRVTVAVLAAFQAPAPTLLVAASTSH